MIAPSFKFKTNKSVTFGLLDNHELLPFPEQKKIFSFTFKNKKHDFDLTKDVWGSGLTSLKNMLDELKESLNKIFNINQYARNKIGFNSTFQSSEKKRLELKKVAEKTLHSRIWNEYVDVFTKHKNSLNDLNNWLTEQEHSKKPYILATRHIRNIYRELKNICKFIDGIIVLGNIGAETEQNIEQEIKTIKNFINQYCNEKKEGNFDFFLLLQFYTKRNTNQDLVYKVALNPAILNTRTTTTAKSFEIQIADLEKSVKELEEKNYKNKQTKSLFLEELEGCINRVLFYNDFFKKSKNTRYREKAKKIYEKYESGYELSEEYEQYVEEILRKENILDLNQEINVANVDERYLERKESCRGLSFLQLKTLSYQLSWGKRAIKDKEKNRKSYGNDNDQSNIDIINENMRTIKGEIQKRIKDGKYGNFVSITGDKATVASELGQKRTELLQKQNIESNEKEYTHFGFLIRKGNRFFIKPYKKEDVLNKNRSFSFTEANNLLDEIKHEEGKYTAYLFKSLTLKAIEKLIFIKKAFGEVNYRVYSNWKQKKYKKNEQDCKQHVNTIISCLKSKQGRELFPYVDTNFRESYTNISEFEKDLLKFSYKIEEHKIEVDEADLIELNIVNRGFEYDKAGDKEYECGILKRNQDIKLFVEGFFNNLNNYRKNGFDTIRLVPEIKIYVRYKLEDGEPEKEQRKKVLVSKKRRFYKSILKGTFLFELNPLDIGQNESNELNQYRKKLKEVNDYYIISVDVGENELATVGIYDKNKNPINIKYKNKEGSIIETNVFNATNMFVGKEGLEERQKDDKQAKYKKFVSLFNQILYASTNIDSIIEKMQKGEKFDNTFFKGIEGMKTEFGLISTGKDSGKFDFFDITTNCTHFKNGIADFLNKKSEEYLNISEDSENKWGICKNKLEKELDFPQINPVLKDAFGSDFLGILNYLFNHFLENGKFCFFVFENLYKGSSSGKNKVNKKYTNTGSNEGDKLNVKLGTYVGLYFLHYIFNYYTKVISYGDNGIYINQYIYNKGGFDKSLKSLGESKYLSNGLLIFVDERYTSQACPVCNNSLYLKPDNEIKCLVGHNKDGKLEEMHHADESDGCDYNMQTKTYGFDYLSSGDDLATHNIAKKGNEYFQSDDFIKTSEPKNEKQGSAFTNNRDSSYKMSGNINISHS